MVQPSAPNVRILHPAQSSKSAKPIETQRRFASSPAVNFGQRSKPAETKAEKGLGDLPVAVTVPSDSPGTTMSLTSVALSQARSH